MITRDKLAVCLIGGVQGLLDLLSLPIFYFYKDILNVSPALISIYQSLALLPWIMKPVFGFLSDQKPICNYRRKSYLILVTLVETFTILYIGLFAKSAVELLVCHFLQVMAMVFRNVIGGNRFLRRGFDRDHHPAVRKRARLASV